ncbi:hypothetical protein F5882DRAFT_376773 [Hyaloscypha sp. PMI_1271]|nr:hypothetical protein F5882DRAFT_376773 [Hyaloscypha sp. PMI_1271]
MASSAAHEILVELKSVKKTLSTRTLTDSGHAQSNAFATYVRAASEAELQHGAPAPGQSETELVSPAIPESRQRKSAATDRSVPLGHASTNSSSEHDVIPSRRGGESLEDETAPTFRYKYKDISKNINEAKFEKLSSNPSVKEKGYFKLVVEDLLPLVLEEASISQLGRDHFTNFSYYRDSQGFVVVTKGKKQEV